MSATSHTGLKGVPGQRSTYETFLKTSASLCGFQNWVGKEQAISVERLDC
jgi:hypothetical protein